MTKTVCIIEKINALKVKTSKTIILTNVAEVLSQGVMSAATLITTVRVLAAIMTTTVKKGYSGHSIQDRMNRIKLPYVS